MDAQSNAVTRRQHMVSSDNSVDLAERRRLGREYLARRNQQMMDRQRQEKEKSRTVTEGSVATALEKHVSNSSFDHLVNDDGSLKSEEKPLPPLVEAAGHIAHMQTPKNEKAARYANPFGDEYEMPDTVLADRSSTANPPVPPKIALEAKPSVAVSEIVRDEPEIGTLTFEEQLARALSLSLGDTEATTRNRKLQQQQQEEDSSLAAAIAASLKEREGADFEQPEETPAQSPNGLATVMQLRDDGISQTSDDLYSLSPQATGVRPVAMTRLGTPHSPDRPSSRPVQGAESQGQGSKHSNISFIDLPSPPSAASSSVSSAAEKRILDQLIDVESNTAESQTSQARAPTQRLPSDDLFSVEFPEDDAALSTHETSRPESHDFPTDSEDDFASLPDVASSRPQSGAQSEASLIEVEDVDSDNMSDDDDGIRTPCSWTDVGSQVGESDRSESEAGDAVRI